MTDGAVISEKSKKPTLLWAFLGILLLVVCAVGTIWLYNQIVLQKPLQHVLLADPRNHVVQANVHFDGWIDTRAVVFDITDVSGEATNMDVFRVLLQYARALKDRPNDKVILAAFGKKKFILPGSYFRELGLEYDTQNPIYTLRTLPNHVANMDGTTPFPEVTGGLLYVLPKELEAFKTFNERWYLNDFVARHK